MSNGIEDAARYSFVPWLRTGAALGIGKQDDFGSGAAGQGERATAEYDVIVNTSTVSQTVRLYGPGDVIGLDRRAIVRLQPGNRVMDFEPNYLPFVDLYDEGLPWRYTPAAPAGQRLRPWLALVALADGEHEPVHPAGAKLPAITVADAGVLPPPDELWAWAHVHVNEDLKPVDGDTDDDARARLKGILASRPDDAGSRIIAPRRLRPNTGYTAFLVPTFETGRLSGLGEDVPAGADGLAPAWGVGPVTLPTYFSWRFRTGVEGDFEHLVRLLQPRVIDPRVGIRDMDVQQPGFGLPGAGPPVLGLEGALRTATTTSTPWPDPASFQSAVTDMVNLAEDLAGPGGPDDPTVTLPLYGRWHGLTRRLGEADTPRWVSNLNLDPRSRGASGLGTRVVQTFQEKYMADAWEQVGEVVRANALLDRARVSLGAAIALYTQHVQQLPMSSLISMTAPVHRRVLGSSTTIAWQLRNSRMSAAVVDPAFRRIMRPGGPVRKRAQGAAGRAPDRVLERVNDGELTAAPPKRPGTGQRPTDADRDQLRPDSLLDRLLARLGRTWWLLPLFILLALILAVVLFAAGAPAVAVVAVVAAAAGALAWRRARTEAEQQGALDLLAEDGFTPESVAARPTRPGFTLSELGDTPPDPGRDGDDSPQGARFRQAAIDFHGLVAVDVPQPPPREPLQLAEVRTKIEAALEPRPALQAYLASVLTFDLTAPGITPNAPERIVPIMAAPDFPYPMSEELGAISSELLIPNLGLIPRNTISLLVTNQPFIEAYMVGLNHEMARELLWREYPTDQRGSYFRQFWDVADTEPPPGMTPEQVADALRDIPPVHTWRRASDLGDHNHRLPPGDDEERLVLVIRGDLFNRYPTAVVTAAPAAWPEDATAADDRDPVYSQEITPMFRAKVGEDINFFGFDLTPGQVDGTRDPEANDPGWFFMVSERPGEPRFGLDVATAPATDVADEWNDVSWGHVGPAAGFETLDNIRLADGLHHVSVTGEDNPEGAVWGSHAGHMAHILYQVPVLVAVHADRMLPVEV